MVGGTDIAFQRINNKRLSSGTCQVAAAFSLALQCLQAPELRCTFASQKLHNRDLPLGSLSPSSTPSRLASSCNASSPSPSGATPSSPSAPRRPSTRSFSRQKTRYLVTALCSVAWSAASPCPTTTPSSLRSASTAATSASLAARSSSSLASSSLASWSSLASSLRLSRSLPSPSLALSSTTVRLRTSLSAASREAASPQSSPITLSCRSESSNKSL